MIRCEAGWRLSPAAAAIFLALAPTPNAAAMEKEQACGWVGAWAASQQLVEPRNELPLTPVEQATIRQTISPTLAGAIVRLRFSNEFGDGPLVIGGATIADAPAAGSAEEDKKTATTLRFAGKRSVLIPPGAAYYSDPVAFEVTPFDDISITTYVETAPKAQTGHPGSRTTTHYAAADALGSAMLQNADVVDHWYYLAGLDVGATQGAVSVGVIGDSITDGHGSTTNHNDRWTDFLAHRLQENEATKNVSVLNLGLGGNRILKDGLGPNVLARVDRDVLAQPDLCCVIVFEGINAIGMLTRGGPASQADHDALVDALKSAYSQIAERVKAHGIKIYGATITPYAGSGAYPFDKKSEKDRQRINKWIRTSGVFDAVIDFDEVARDPDDPTRLLPAYDSGDHLHPSPAGFKAFADAVPLELFAPSTDTACHY